MNAARIKALLWLASLSIAGYLGWYVYRFVEERDALRQGVPAEEQRAVLDSVPTPEPPKDDIVAYDAIRTVFHQMNWTGTEATPPPSPGPAVPEAKPKTAVSDLLSVVLIQVDVRDPAANLAVVRFKDPKLQMAVKVMEDAVLRPAEKLTSPHEHIQVKRIEVEGVTFTFTDDAQRPEETIAPLPFPSDDFGIVDVGPDGALEPQRKSSGIARSESYPAWRPLETQQVRANEFVIGTQTAAQVEQDYSRILSQDVSYQPYRNPRTREIEGLRITYVRGGSLVADHGISEGEILKSINGYTVKSASDAIAYVKKAADTTDTWLAVFEKQGKEFTRTYKSPPSE